MVRSDRRRNDQAGPSKRSQNGASWSDNQKIQKGPKPVVEENSDIVKAFRVFRTELDNKHDKHERLVKLSRDVTIESKRTIFLLHRITGGEDRQTLLQEAQEKLDSIRSRHLAQIARELDGEDPYLFQRAVSPGYQEYVEAALFHGYLKHEKLMGLDEVRGQLVFTVPVGDDHDNTQTEDSSTLNTEEALCDDEGGDQATPTIEDPALPQTRSFALSPLDYVLGVADFTGELMRMCISCIGSGDTETPFTLVAFLRELYDSFQLLGNQPGREFTRKLSVMRQSVSKVEKACYMVRVRGSEIPKHMLLDAISSLPGDADNNSSSNQGDYME